MAVRDDTKSYTVVHGPHDYNEKQFHAVVPAANLAPANSTLT